MRRLLPLLALLFGFETMVASTFTVTNANDAGSGSLREAMTFCNITPGADNVVFNIAGIAPHTIYAQTSLPILNDPGTTINGTTQPANGYTGTGRKIIIDGSLMTNGNGIEVNGANFTLKGVRIQKFPYHGLVINPGANSYVLGGVNEGNTISENQYAGVQITGASNGVIKGNCIGTDDDGLVAKPNQYEGISLFAGANGTVVGGVLAGEGNVISGNLYYGLQLEGASNCTIYGNMIGVDATGSTAIPNEYYGILLSENANGNSIGSAASGAGNVISGNLYHGIAIECSSNNGIRGNKIGTDITGGVSIPNEYSGIDIGPTSSNFTCNATNNVIGGIASGESNTIANNLYYGVNIWGTNAKFNPVRGNRIFCNSYDGFTLHDGNYGQPDGNNGYASPVISTANLGGATGTAAANDFVDLYLDDACPNCEPRTFVATVQANGSGNWSYTGSLSGSLTAIATHPTNGNSSANSPCMFISNSTAPVASFTSIAASFCGSGCTNFIDFSTGQPTSWSWSFPGGTPSTSSLQNPQNICWNAPGSYDVILTVTNLGGSDTETMVGYIVVDAIPTVNAGPDQSICPGDTAQLQGQSNGGYDWSPGVGLSDSTVANPAAFPTGTTTYVLYGQIGNCDASDTVTVTVFPAPSVSINQLGTLLTASSGTTFQWYLNGVAIPGATSQSYTAQTTGSYTVAVTDANGCSAVSAAVLVDVLGMDGLMAGFEVVLVPNPSRDICMVQVSGLVETTLECRVSDLLGREVGRQIGDVVIGKASLRLDVTGLPAGIYNVSLVEGERRLVRSLVVAR